jgi:hypothetical protein
VGIVDFCKAWKRKDPRKLVEKHMGFPQHHTTGTKAWKQLQAKAAIVSACGALAATLATPFSQSRLVEIYSKPRRKVVALAAEVGGGGPGGGGRPWKPGEIILTPDTIGLKVIARDGAGSDMPRLPEVTFAPPDEDFLFFLLPAVAEKDVAPLWCVQETTDPKEANMVWGHYLVSSLTGFDFQGKPAPCMPKRRRKVAKVGGSAVEVPSRKRVKTAPSKAATGRLDDETPPLEEDVEEEKDVDEEVVRRVVRVPVLINKVPLATGAELLVHQVAAGKKVRLDPAITMGSLRRRI